MIKFKLFAACRSGSLRETTSLIAAAVTLLGVGAAMGLDHMTRDGDFPRIVILPSTHQFASRLPTDRSAGEPTAMPLDDTPVGSIPARLSPIRLDPCTGDAK